MKLEKRIAELKSLYGGKPVYSKNAYVESFCLFLSRWSYKLTRGLYFDIKFTLQKILKGYNDLDKWNVAWYISRKAIPILKEWRNSKIHGTAVKRHIEDRHGNIKELADDEVLGDKNDPEYFTVEEWKALIDEIIFAFQFVANEDVFIEEFTEETYKQNYKKYKRGMKLLSIYFLSLWD